MEDNQLQVKSKVVEFLSKPSVLYVLITMQAITFGSAFVWTKTALEELSTIQVIACRWTVAAIILTVLALTKSVKVNFRGKPIKLVMLTALAQPCIYMIVEVIGIDLTTSSESAIILAMIPLVIALTSAVLFKTVISPLAKMGIIIAFAGIIMMIAFTGAFSAGGKFIGYVCLLAAVVCTTVYTLMASRISDIFTPMEITLTMAVQGSVFFNIIVIAQGGGFSGYAACLRYPDVGVAILCMGIGCSTIAYIIYNFAVSKLPPHQVSVISANVVTITGVVTGIIFKGDPYGWYTVVGLIMVAVGIVLVNRKKGEDSEI